MTTVPRRIWLLAASAALRPRLVSAGAVRPVLGNGVFTGIRKLSVETRVGTEQLGYTPTPGFRVSSAVEEPSERPEPPIPVERQTMVLSEPAYKQIQKIMSKEGIQGLRLAVESGGCHGYQYKFEVAREIDEEDFVFHFAGGARLAVDSASLRLVAGSEIDYATELIGSAFRVKHNPQSITGSGCGCGVSWDLKELS